MAVGVDKESGLPQLSRQSDGEIPPSLKIELTGSGSVYKFVFPEGHVTIKVSYWSAKRTYYLNLNIVVPGRFKTSAGASGLCLEGLGSSTATREGNKVPSGESLFNGGTVPATEQPVYLTPEKDPDNFLKDARRCTSVEIPKPGSTWHSKRYTAHVRGGSPAEYKRVWEELGDGVAGYCKKVVTSWSGISNQALCGNKENWYVQMKSRFTVTGANSGSWCFRLGADLGGGGAMFVDGAPMTMSSSDLWWDNSWGRTADILQGCKHLSAGEHDIEIYGWEGCCDGAQTLQFKAAGSNFKVWSPQNLPIFVPAPETVEEEQATDVTDLVNTIAKSVPKINFGDPPVPEDGHDEVNIDDLPMPEGLEDLCTDFFSTTGPHGEAMSKAVALGIDLSEFIGACEIDTKASGGDDEVLMGVGAALINEAIKLTQEKQKEKEEKDYWVLQGQCDFCNGKGPCVEGKCHCEFPWKGLKCDHLIIEKPKVTAVHTEDDVYAVTGTGFFPEETHYCIFGTNKVVAKYVSRFNLLCEAPGGTNPKDGLAVTGDEDVAIDKFMDTTTTITNDKGKTETVVVSTGHKVASKSQNPGSIVYYTSSSVYVCSWTFTQVQCFGNQGTCAATEVNWEYVGYSAPGDELSENTEVTIGGSTVSWNNEDGITIQPSADLYCTKPLESCRCF